MSSGNSLKLSSLVAEKLFNRLGHSTAPYASADAFRQLYEMSHRSIFRFIYALSNGVLEDAEDLTAETYERAWKARKSFRGDEDAAMGWLVTIARNLVIDRQRQQRRILPPHSLDVIADELSSSADVEQQVLRSEQQAMILTALQTLPVQDREILLLRYLLGWRVKQIAEHNGLLENTISVKIRRALVGVRQQLSQEKGDENE